LETKITAAAAERDLGLVWRPMQQTIIEHAYSLIRYGVAPNKLYLKKTDAVCDSLPFRLVLFDLLC
jgi:hypothetical protein